MHINYLFDVFNEFENNDSIIWNGTNYSYKSLIKNIEKSQLLIDSQQIKPGTVTALIGDFSPNSIASFNPSEYGPPPQLLLVILISRKFAYSTASISF